MKRIIKYSEAIIEVKNHLTAYMIAHGIQAQPSGQFSCPNKYAHNNGDKTPSAKLFSSGTSWKCYACGASGNVVTMAHIIHDLPIEGGGILYETLPHIYEAIGEDVQVIPDGSTDELPEDIQWHLSAKKYINEHPITPEVLQDGSFGRTYNNVTVQNLLSTFKIAYTTEHITDNPLLNIPTQYPPNIIYPIYYKGVIRSIQARNSTENISKYIIHKYFKSLKINNKYYSLINYDKAVIAAKRQKLIYLFEGLFNTLVAVSYGIRNAMGVSGTHPNLIELEQAISDAEVTEIVFVGDKDRAGAEALYKLAEHFQKLGYIVHTLMPRHIDLDYDIEIDKYGQEAIDYITDANNHINFIEMAPILGISYFSDKSLSLEAKFDLYLKTISELGSPIGIDKYARAFAIYAESISKPVNLIDIIPAIREAIIDASSPLLNKTDEIVSDFLGNFDKITTVQSKIDSVHSLYSRLSNMIKVSSEGIKKTQLRYVNELLSNNDTAGVKIYNTGYTNMDIYNEEGTLLLGIERHSMIGIVGKPSHGKSMIARGIALHIAQVEREDTIGVYASIDDYKDKTLLLLMSAISGINYSVLKKNYKERTDDINAKIEIGKEKLKSIYGESLLVFGKDTISSYSDIGPVISAVEREYRGKKIILYIDNLYNLDEIIRGRAGAGGGDPRHAIGNIIENLKMMSQGRLELVFNTLESRKGNGRINENDIKETGAIDYKNDITLSMFNSVREYKEQSKMIEVIDGRPTPVIEVQILKNKDSATGRVFYFFLNGPRQTLRPITDPLLIEQYNMRRIKDRGSRNVDSEVTI